MFKIPVAAWIVNAAARLAGNHGHVTHQAQAADCSRQTVYDHAQKVQAAIEAEHSGGLTRAELLEQNQRLSQENAQLWGWLAQTIEFPKDKQRQFTVTALAMGLSLNQVLALLTLILGAKACPGRSTLQRWVKAAGHAAGRVLKHLDAHCRTLVLVGCLDEIFFHRRPVLVGVEPASMVWFLGQKADDRTAATWSRALQGFAALSYVLADAGTGLQAGIAAVQQQRQQDGCPPLENGLDVFHTTQEARRVLRQIWSRVEGLWEQAESADRRVAQAQQQGRDARGAAVTARCAWTRAVTAFRHFESSEAGWRIAGAALQVFRPDGRLNDRLWAQGQIALALPRLSGREWSKVRNYLQAQQTLTFLDRLHRQLEEVAPEGSLRAELVRLWWLRRQRPRATPAGRITGAGHVAHLVQQVVCHQVDAHWHGPYRAVARVLRQAVRASSAVECMNSVLRMHQARHRTVTQELLDLKRLYWNCRVFREGKRRGRCPYEHLGLKLPSYQFWDLLGMPTPIGVTP
ncbi:MAG: hypothetical protein JO329_08585 [Planctomycetaceae bacterium]|jgi:hypothetical protein|nr:hypothetical protein [Planctomycetaceae bacterium]MBV8383849.1 hypothetical protein [Planctomycetaceae bacterium]